MSTEVTGLAAKVVVIQPELNAVTVHGSPEFTPEQGEVFAAAMGVTAKAAPNPNRSTGSVWGYTGDREALVTVVTAVPGPCAACGRAS